MYARCFLDVDIWSNLIFETFGMSSIMMTVSFIEGTVIWFLIVE